MVFSHTYESGERDKSKFPVLARAVRRAFFQLVKFAFLTVNNYSGAHYWDRVIS